MPLSDSIDKNTKDTHPDVDYVNVYGTRGEHTLAKVI